MRLELFTPCEAVSPDGEPCANGDSETRPNGPQHYTSGWPRRKDGKPDRRYRWPVGVVTYWTDAAIDGEATT